MTGSKATRLPPVFLPTANFTIARSLIDLLAQDGGAGSKAGISVSVHIMYFETMARGAYPITATGDDDISRLIPHGFYSGRSFCVANLVAHAVYFADELTLNDFMLSIEWSGGG